MKTKDTGSQKRLASHTPGPWRWYWQQDVTDGAHEAACGVYHEKREGHAYSICRAPRYAKREEWEANARLIAAAPDLLAVCEIIASGKGGYMPELRAAIAKAKGEAWNHPQVRKSCSSR